MLCCHLEHLNRCSPSPVPINHGRGLGCGHGGRCVVTHATLNLREEVPPTGEQHVEEAGIAQPGGDDAPPPPPLLSEVMDPQTRLMETLAERLLHHNGGPPNDFQRKLEGFLKLSPPTFDSSDDDTITTED